MLFWDPGKYGNMAVSRLDISLWKKKWLSDHVTKSKYSLELTRTISPFGLPSKSIHNGELFLPLYHHRMWHEIFIFNLTLMHKIGPNSALSPLWVLTLMKLLWGCHFSSWYSYDADLHCNTFLCSQGLKLCFVVIRIFKNGLKAQSNQNQQGTDL